MIRTLIIAEAGVNHNGDLNAALRMVEVAAKAGADCIKFQTFSADRLVTKSASKADYQKSDRPEESQYEMLCRYELSAAMHEKIKRHCTKHGISFLSTGFDKESVDYLVGLGVEWLKVPSGEVTNLPYLEHVGMQGLPVILSTGMSTLYEVDAAVGVLVGAGLPREDIVVLHCTTEYPTPMQDVNLQAMLTMADELDMKVGYSDHTLGIEVPVAAVALGAIVIEKHFTLDRNLPGPDHRASLEPGELSHMVKAIRNIERALGDGIKCPTPGEIKNRGVARKSIVAARDIKEGEIFSEDNISTKRPGTGLSPMRWYEVLGHSATKNYKKDELIEI